MPKPSSLDYSKLDEQLEDIEPTIQGDPNVDLSEVELLSGLITDNFDEMTVKLQNEVQQSLGDDLLKDIAEEGVKNIVEESLDFLVDVLDGPAANAQDAVAQTAAETLANHPDLATAMTEPEYAQAICDALSIAL